jgi:hypothetical protein
MVIGMRTLGVEEELLVVSPARAAGSASPTSACTPRTLSPSPAAAADVLDARLDTVRPALRDAGAGLQRPVHRRTGDLAAVVRDAVDRTAHSGGR